MIDQAAIALTGCLAIWLTNSDGPERRYAPIFGLLGQPFWMYAAYSAEQWGILVLTIWYTAAWWRGFRTHWMRRGP